MEFRRKYSEVKNYKANMISTLFNEFIFIIGLFFMIKNVGKLNTTMIFCNRQFLYFSNCDIGNSPMNLKQRYVQKLYLI